MKQVLVSAWILQVILTGSLSGYCFSTGRLFLAVINGIMCCIGLAVISVFLDRIKP